MTAMVLSSLLLVLSGAALWPYSITERNYFYLPYYDRFTPDYLNGRAPFYYPAAEADRAFAVSVSVCGLLLAVSGLAPAAGLSAYVRQLPVFLAPAWMAHRYFCLHRLNRYTPRRLLRTMRPFSRYEPWKAVAVWLAVVLAPLLLALLPSGCRPAVVPAVYAGAAFLSGCCSRSGRNRLCACRLAVLAFSAAASLSVSRFGVSGAGIWALGLSLLKAVEYVLRFRRPACGDRPDHWGPDIDWTWTASERRRLDRLVRLQSRAWRRTGGRPCWRFVVEPEFDEPAPAVCYAADAELMVRELALREQRILRRERFDGPERARKVCLGKGDTYESE